MTKYHELDDPAFSQSTREQLLFVPFNPFGFHGRVPSEPSGINSLPLSLSLSLSLEASRIVENRNGIKILHVITCISTSRWYSFWWKMAKVCSSEEPQRPLNWKIESRTGEKMRLCDPLTQIARHTADISRWIEHTSRFAVGRSPIDNLLDFIGSCIAINSSHLTLLFLPPSLSPSLSLLCLLVSSLLFVWRFVERAL